MRPGFTGFRDFIIRKFAINGEIFIGEQNDKKKQFCIRSLGCYGNRI